MNGLFAEETPLVGTVAVVSPQRVFDEETAQHQQCPHRVSTSPSATNCADAVAVAPCQHHQQHSSSSSSSPLPLSSPSAVGGSGDAATTPTTIAKACLFDYRGERVAGFQVGPSCRIFCLPQMFELFLKRFVGGLHTVYTKLRRLGIQPLICNVEQVRALRNLGAIQLSVNRCKLIETTDFETLYSARPGRPLKRTISDTLHEHCTAAGAVRAPASAGPSPSPSSAPVAAPSSDWRPTQAVMAARTCTGTATALLESTTCAVLPLLQNSDQFGLCMSHQPAAGAGAALPFIIPNYDHLLLLYLLSADQTTAAFVDRLDQCQKQQQQQQQEQPSSSSNSNTTTVTNTSHQQQLLLHGLQQTIAAAAALASASPMPTTTNEHQQKMLLRSNDEDETDGGGGKRRTTESIGKKGNKGDTNKKFLG